MLKWSEYTEAEVTFEAFLPEHEKEAQTWLLRASSNGHVLAEKFIRLTWPPRFGPDAGDVDALESALEHLLHQITPATARERGDYHPGPVEIGVPDPYTHASLSILLDSFIDAAGSLGISEELTGKLVRIPPGWDLRGLFPMAVTSSREARMSRLVALQNVVGRYPVLVERLNEAVTFLIDEDTSSLKQLLENAGVPVPGESYDGKQVS